MIYLIDDKKQRQAMLRWTEENFRKYEEILLPVYSYNQIVTDKLNTTDKIFSPESIILYHESFFDHVDYANKSNSAKIRNKLSHYSQKRNIPLVQFGGAIKHRTVRGMNITLPVEVLYRNLGFFLDSINAGVPIEESLQHLLFGQNPKIEEILQLKKEIWETQFKLSPLLNQKILEFNRSTGKHIDLRQTQNPALLKTLINE